MGSRPVTMVHQTMALSKGEQAEKDGLVTGEQAQNVALSTGEVVSVTPEAMALLLADITNTPAMDIKEEEDNQTDIVVVFIPEKQFPCEMCVKTFTRKDSLKRHLKICKKGVANTANLRCVKCGKTFSTCSNRIKHEKKSKCNKE